MRNVLETYNTLYRQVNEQIKTAAPWGSATSELTDKILDALRAGGGSANVEIYKVGQEMGAVGTAVNRDN